MSESKAGEVLGEKWKAETGRHFMTGTQALVKLLMMQAAKDKAAGLDTAGFVSGYRGSPLGGLDHALWRAKDALAAAGVKFEPGLNEELGATMVWGTQQAILSPGFAKDGVFGMWYGKGPGVDRAMDAIKHANAAGTTKHGGVLAIAGDDHAARSSTMPHQSDHMFMAAMMPTLAPSDPQEFIDLGLHGYAMSRYSGCWVGMLAVADTVESGCVVDVDGARVKTLLPSEAEFPMPEGGAGLRWPDEKMAQEARLQEVKVYAALAYARKNGLNKIMGARVGARLGIVSCGKAWRDVIQALEDLGVSMEECERLGIRLLKLGMSWPLESEVVKEFSDGLDEIMVVEEKRPIVEYLIKEQLYNWEGERRPRVVGKFDDKGEWALPHGNWLLPARGELTPADVALAIASRIAHWPQLGAAAKAVEARVEFLKAKRATLAAPVDALARAPHYCSGCPHNSSTKVPEGSRALAGIGCHFMATWIYPQTQTVSQMGGEGVAWAGIAPFTGEKHVFANLGDGTFWHSGSLAIRQSVAARANITYKLLHNDAVAMTGGQPVEGAPGPVKMLWAIWAESPVSIDIVAEDPGKWRELQIKGAIPEARIHARDAMDRVQDECKAREGVSVIFYDQTCASEKRRRRKRGTYEQAPRKAWINPEVCEGCGDCSKASNCLSVEPLETPWGRKRRIDQKSCNQDLACVDGFCPAIVTVQAPAVKKMLLPKDPGQLPDACFAWNGSGEWNVVVAGVGGQGVVTLAQVLGVAAALDGLEAMTLDQTGLAQKGGAVMSHLRLAKGRAMAGAARVPDGECDLMLVADLPTACLKEAMLKLDERRSSAVSCASATISSAFLSNPDLDLKQPEMKAALSAACRSARFEPARELADEAFGSEVAGNFILAGLAWQMGLLPIGLGSIMEAIEANGAGIDSNKAAFAAGRALALSGSGAAGAAKPAPVDISALGASVPSWEMQEGRARSWGGSKAVADHEAFKARLMAELGAKAPELERQALALSWQRLRLACVKDEYEVARLHAESTRSGALSDVGSSARLAYHMAPPVWFGNPADAGRKVKFAGWWMGPVLGLLAKMSFLRGGWLDPFARSKTRKSEAMESRLFERDALMACSHMRDEPVDRLRRAMSRLSRDAAKIRGFGKVRDAAREAAMAERDKQLVELGINLPLAK